MNARNFEHCTHTITMQCVSLHTSLFVLSPSVSVVGVAVSLSEWPRLTPAPLYSFVWSTPVLYYYYTHTYYIIIISSIVTIFMYVLVVYY